ncbi:MAG: tetraacyldisaccharide 4-kinase [Betaproteobacteria bacterium]|nr:tetraacyldisaccharide 4-kinase [Betaproteobacteria bacterium]
MSRWLERNWARVTAPALALYPLSLIFRALVALRRAAYANGLMHPIRLPIPVIIVGNISVGGTGKTPLVLWLATFLKSHGYSPGIVSRGYGARDREPRPVAAASDPLRFGDEPVLLAQRSTTPVWIGADRVAAIRALLSAHAECNVVLSDDGLQHYRLARDVEIAVVDGARGLGNQFMLPAGPLREPPSRLTEVDAVVVNGSTATHLAAATLFTMNLEGRQFRNLLNPEHTVDADHFQRKSVLAIAGIGNPARFFAHLNRLGVSFRAQPFPDHHVYAASDLEHAQADAIVMTEKDAVKCAAFASEKHWVLPVDAVPSPELGELILRKLKS